jgi:hypothetical protein
MRYTGLSDPSEMIATTIFSYKDYRIYKSPQYNRSFENEDSSEIKTWISYKYAVQKDKDIPYLFDSLTATTYKNAQNDSVIYRIIPENSLFFKSLLDTYELVKIEKINRFLTRELYQAPASGSSCEVDSVYYFFSTDPGYNNAPYSLSSDLDKRGKGKFVKQSLIYKTGKVKEEMTQDVQITFELALTPVTDADKILRLIAIVEQINHN